MGQPGNHMACLVQQNKWSEALKEAQRVRNFYYRFPQNSFSYFFRACCRAFVPNYLLSFRNWYRGLNTEFNLKREVEGTIINYDFAKKVNLLDRIIKLQSHTVKSAKINMHQLHVKALQHPYLTVGLERYDRVASLYGIEPRHPLLDLRFVEYCVAIPWTQKISNGWTKHIARRAMIGLLPEEVIWRRGWEHLGPRLFVNFVLSRYQAPTEYYEENIDMIRQFVDNDEVRRVLQILNSSETVPEWSDCKKIYDAIVLGTYLKKWS
jgi:asparagine synthase (glutamine-hydrolysing)